MRDIKALEAELRAGLVGVTPGPWKHTGREGLGIEPSSELIHSWNKASDRRGFPIASAHGPDNTETPANAAHIARCSPENIAALLDTIEQQRAAISSYEAARETGWRSIEAWAVFHEGKPFTITFKAEVANAYAAAGLDVRQLSAAPSPDQEPRP